MLAQLQQTKRLLAAPIGVSRSSKKPPRTESLEDQLRATKLQLAQLQIDKWGRPIDEIDDEF